MPAPTKDNPDAKKTVSENRNATESLDFKGWTVTANSYTFCFPATGVRDMGVKNRDVSYGTFPGLSLIHI